MNSQNTKSFSIKRNDQVQVIAGREKGKTGKVLKIDSKSGKVTVEKLNMIKRHVKPSQTAPQGGIVEKEGTLHYSNILLFCGKCNRGVRHGMKLVEKASKGKAGSADAAQKAKIRVCKKCGQSLDASA